MVSESVSSVGTEPAQPRPAEPGAERRPTVQELLPDDDPVQLLSADGVFRADARAPLDLDDGQLRSLFELMTVIRAVDREAINLQRQGQLGVYASCLGQEAAQVGSAFALDAGDWMFPSYRELGAAIVRGVDPVRMLHLNRGTWLSDHDPYQHGVALQAIPIGTQALHATGFAIGAALDDAPTVTIAYFGDGGTSEGDTHEALTFAGVMQAPVVFFLQNNQYAISVPAHRQSAAPTLAHKGIGYGIPSQRVDGNDVLATYAVTRQAVRRARSGGGPTLIEAVTYRMESHTTSDDASRYRSQDELDAAASRDPLSRFTTFLRSRGIVDDAMQARVEEQAGAAAAEVRAALYDAPHGDPRELFSHVYVDPDGHFEEQSKMLEDELEARGDGGA